jgi:ABC-2 type transport system ATP-binding protein
VLAGIYKKDSGDALIMDTPVGSATHKHISYMPDFFFLYDWMKIKDAINYYNDLFNDFDMEKCKKICENLKLREEDKIKTLSKGMKDRILVMLAFSRNTKVYVLDEPIGGVDPVAKDLILKTVIGNTNDESTVLLSTHLVKDVEKILDEVILIKEGKILEHKSCDYIREEKKQSVEEFYLEVMQND